jgi:hypothetical protein
VGVVKQFDVFPAVFSPQRRDDLKEEVERWIGWRGLWEAAYVIEESEYEGQFACVVRPDQEVFPPPSAFVWTPECDLRNIGEPSLGEFIAAGSAAFRASMDFEKAMRQVSDAVGASPEQIADLQRLAASR